MTPSTIRRFHPAVLATLEDLRHFAAHPIRVREGVFNHSPPPDRSEGILGGKATPSCDLPPSQIAGASTADGSSPL